jgi:hypothetical protein
MTSKVLADILTRHGKCERDGNLYCIPAKTDATVYASFGSDVLIIERVSTVDLDAEVCSVTTTRNDHFVLVYEDVRALRFADAKGNVAGLKKP